MKLVLPYPPSANNYWRIARNRIFVTLEAKNYKNAVKWRALHQNVKPIEGMVCVKLDVYRPRAIRDLDNTLKILLDALNGVAWEDDSQIVGIVAQRYEDKDNPRVELSARELSG